MPIPTPLILAAFDIAGPIILELIKRHRAPSDDPLPTLEELRAEYLASGDKILDEIAAWRARHPPEPPDVG